jgi:hypothetical protein
MWMLPPIEFSIGSRPWDARPSATEAKTCSNRSHAITSEAGHAFSAAGSL